jgi:hypothetical protein
VTGKLFISYRRDDSAGHAGRLRDRLEREFGRDLLFMDVDAIPLGLNFIKVLRDEVAKCDVLLAVIGPNWATILDKNGKRRLDDKNDFVRIEIATALTRDIPVIPVLLDNAELPKPEQLPPDLEELSVRNGIYVRHASFHGDMDRLIAGLRGPLGASDIVVPPTMASSTAATRDVVERAAPSAQVTQSRRRWPALLFGAAVVVAAGVVAAIIFKKPPPSSAPVPPLPVQSSAGSERPVPMPSPPPPTPRMVEVAPAPSSPAPAPPAAKSAPIEPPAAPVVAALPKPAQAPPQEAEKVPPALAESLSVAPTPAPQIPPAPVQAAPKHRQRRSPGTSLRTNPAKVLRIAKTVPSSSCCRQAPSSWARPMASRAVRRMRARSVSSSLRARSPPENSKSPSTSSRLS